MLLDKKNWDPEKEEDFPVPLFPMRAALVAIKKNLPQWKKLHATLALKFPLIQPKLINPVIWELKCCCKNAGQSHMLFNALSVILQNALRCAFLDFKYLLISQFHDWNRGAHLLSHLC